MNLHSIIAGALSLVLLCGCASSPSGWTKSSVASTDLQRDKAECAYQAKAATSSYHSSPSKKGEAAALGAAIGDGIVIAEKQVELTNECMRSRGYVPQ